MKRPLQIEWAARSWRGPIVVGLFALVVLGVVGFFVVRALGGTQQLAVLMEQVQTVGLRMRDWIEQSGPWAPLPTSLRRRSRLSVCLGPATAQRSLGRALRAVLGRHTTPGHTLGGCILYVLSRWAGRPAVARIVGESHGPCGQDHRHRPRRLARTAVLQGCGAYTVQSGQPGCRSGSPR